MIAINVHCPLISSGFKDFTADSVALRLDCADAQTDLTFSNTVSILFVTNVSIGAVIV